MGRQNVNKIRPRRLMRRSWNAKTENKNKTRRTQKEVPPRQGGREGGGDVVKEGSEEASTCGMCTNTERLQAKLQKERNTCVWGEGVTTLWRPRLCDDAQEKTNHRVKHPARHQGVGRVWHLYSVTVSNIQLGTQEWHVYSVTVLRKERFQGRAVQGQRRRGGALHCRLVRVVSFQQDQHNPRAQCVWMRMPIQQAIRSRQSIK